MPSARTGKRATSPAANTSSCPGTRPYSSTTNSVVDLQPGGLGELGVRDHAQAGDDGVRVEREAGLGLDPAPRGRCDKLLGAHVDALLAVVVRDELREAEREEAEADSGLREEHRDASSRCRRAPAAISEPMNPPPITTTWDPSGAISRRRR